MTEIEEKMLKKEKKTDGKRNRLLMTEFSFGVIIRMVPFLF